MSRAENVRTRKGNVTLGRQIVVGFVVTEFVLLMGNLTVRLSQREGWFPSWMNGCLAIASAVPIAIFAARFFHLMRQDLDEMVQRVVLEGLAFAMVVFVPLAGLYVNARVAGIAPTTLDPPEILLIPSILVATGILISWSRVK